MEAAQKKRTGAKGWLTRASEALNKLVAPRPSEAANGATQTQLATTRLALEDAISNFNLRLNAWDTAQAEVEELLDEDKIDEEISVAFTYREKACIPRIKAQELLSTMSGAKVPSNGDNSASGSTSGSSSESSSGRSMNFKQVNLPKLELPTFEGKVTEWPSFWEQFVAVVDSSDRPEITKFAYLRSLLKGEAKSAVDGLSLTASGYKTACDILAQRYGRKEQIVFAHIQELLNISVQGQKTSHLWCLQDQLQLHVRSLEALGVSGEQYGVVLTPVVLSRLPTDLRMEWARTGSGHEGDLTFLMEFLKTEIERRERSQVFIEPTDKRSVCEKTRKPTAAALFSNSDGNKKGCSVCKKKHFTEKCWNLTRVSFLDRKSKIKELKLCFKCLTSKHVAKNCNKVCSGCSGQYHKLICNVCNPSDNEAGSLQTPSVSNNGANVSAEPTSSVGSSVSHEIVSHNVSKVLLQVIPLNVKGKNGTVKTNVYLDTGADRSYITDNLVKQVNPQFVGTQQFSCASFGNKTAGQCKVRNMFSVDLLGLNGGSHSVVVTSIANICAPVYRPKIPDHFLNSFDETIVSNENCKGENVEIGMLIGLDNYWKLVKPEIKNLHEGLVAQNTIFGWIASGTLEQGEGESSCLVSHQLFVNDVCENLWNLESIGINSDEGGIIDPIWDEFNQNIVLANNRYEVSLPWKKSHKKLIDNQPLALKRLYNLNVRLDKNPALKVEYNQALADMEKAGFIHAVPADEIQSSFPIYYLPHRPVVKNQSVSTRVRPVFDASAPSYNGTSLNDCLYTGPCLIPDLVEILIRFRRWPIAVTADIQKAFLQIRVKREDQDVHRFLWQHGGKVRTMRFDRVPFGNKSSPFLLNTTIKYHLSSVGSSRTVKELEDNLYVDDFLSGANDCTEACDMLDEANKIMGLAGFPLAKWGSSSSEVTKHLEHNFQVNPTGDEMCVLGLRWSTVLDCFSFNILEFPQGLVVTKRVVLSVLSRIFDPLGFLAPFSILIRILFQELWTQKLDWDDPVSESQCQRFMKWIEGLHSLHRWKIPRSYTGEFWVETGLELHGFGDASEKAYSTCVYLVKQTPDGRRSASLVVSKAKVAPLKRQTLPRLELLGSLLTARCVAFVKRALRLENFRLFYWSDSTVALGWIRGEPSQWKTFIGNRVSEIHQLSDPSSWNHCPGTDNPSDLATRGVLAEQLAQDHCEFWLHGPTWLLENDPLSCVGGQCSVPDECYTEAKSPVESVLAVNTSSFEQPFDTERWSSMGKCVRVVAWALRFISNCRSKRRKTDRLTQKELSASELSGANDTLISMVQFEHFGSDIQSLRQCENASKTSNLYKLSPFLDEEGLLRVRGRLQHSNLTYDEKHPILLPKCWFSLLILRHHHLTCSHAGVEIMMNLARTKYWILNLRRIAKQVKRFCIPCQRLDSQPCQPKMAPLPKDRVERSHPFSITGVDHTGPLYCADFNGKKFYILLFTCGVIRAVHLELVNSMNLEDTMLAYRRFVARRGIPSKIYSDNAKVFKAMKMELKGKFGVFSPSWIFIAPRAPWWGGWWERLMRPVKSSLKKCLGLKCFKRVQLETLVHEVEAQVNSRPLVYSGDEIDSVTPLTPSHFLIGRTSSFQKPLDIGDEPVSGSDLLAKGELMEQTLNSFWERWSSDYLKNLRPWCGSENKLRVNKGSLVLIREDGIPRMKWKIGSVTKLFPGSDKVARAAEVKTVKGTYTRPIQRLHILEVAETPSEEDMNIPLEDGAVQSVDDAGPITDDHAKVVEPASGKNEVLDSNDRYQDNSGKGGPSSKSVDRKTRCGRLVKSKTILDL